MPCFTRKNNISFRPKQKKGTERDALAPKPVRPTAMRFHGLLGTANTAQHLIIDQNWTPESLTDQYNGFINLLSRRVIYKYHESKANRKNQWKKCQILKRQCVDGRIKLQKISFGNNAHTIRNYLSNHKDMQRLYQKMPIHLVQDNINQRTFILRKERDRLEYRLSLCKDEYKNLLLERAEVENRIKYANEFVREEEIVSRRLYKKIENSNVRLNAIRTINTTYRKIIQVLSQDAIFYEPILRSLDSDMEDQANFIKYILYLGTPAITKFKHLNVKFRQLEQKSRKNFQSKVEMLHSLTAPSRAPTAPVKFREELPPSVDPRRYIRETVSMLVLKNQLKSVEKKMRELKIITFSSQIEEIYPNGKAQIEKNKKLERNIHLNVLKHNKQIEKLKYTEELKNILVHNLSEEEINRSERIKDLRKTLEKEKQFEDETLEYMINRGNAFVRIRMFLWNLIDILRHIDRQPRTFNFNYKTSYLSLPLLKFEMLDTRAAPPEQYEEDLVKIMSLLKRKVYRLMKKYNAEMEASIKECKEKYHNAFMESLQKADNLDEDRHSVIVDASINNKITNVPNSKQIKAQSARLVEESIAKEL